MDSSKLIAWQTRFKKELFDSVIPFWVKHSPDTQSGGIFSCLDRTGKVYSTDKSIWMQGRSAWLFSRLCSLYGTKPEWLSVAESCIGFLDKYGADPSDGRHYYSVTRDGKPLRKRRYYSSEVYSMAAHAEYAALTENLPAMEKARGIFDMTYRICKDPDSDPYQVTPKFIAETRPTHNLTKYMMLLEAVCVLQRCDTSRREVYDCAIKELIAEIVKYHYREDISAMIGTVGADGEFLDFYPAGRLVSPGHSFILCWELLDQAEILDKPEYISIAKNMFNWAYEIGWDETFGGIVYLRDVMGYPPEQFEHDMKLWWVICEAVLAALRLYEVTGKEQFFNRFEILSNYMLEHYPDPEYGEWYGYLRRDGKPTEPASKGGMFKGPYHIPRMLMYLDASIARQIKERGI